MAKRKDSLPQVPSPVEVRCWMSNVEQAKREHGEDSPEYAKALDRPSTCLLPNGHAGEHAWTFDGDVTFAFKSKGGNL